MPTSSTPSVVIPAKRQSIGSRINWQTVLIAGSVAVVVYLVLTPLVMTLLSTFRPGGRLPFEAGPWTLKNYVRIFSNPTTYQLLGNTFLFAGGSLLIGFSMAVTFSWLVERTDIPCRDLIYSVIMVPMAIPGMLAAISWIFLLSPSIGLINLILRGLFGFGNRGPLNIYTIPGMFFVEGLRMIPTVFLMVSGAFRNMDPALEEASRVAGQSTMSTMFRVTLPLMRPAILGALIYYFIVAIEAFEIPGIIGLTAGLHVFSTRIFWATHPDPGLPDYGTAGTLAIILLAFALLLTMVYNYLTAGSRKYSTVTGKGFRPARISLGKWRYPALGLFLFYFVIAVILPIFILAWASFQPYYQPPSWAAFKDGSLAPYLSLWRYPSVPKALRNTVALSLVTATVTMLLSAMIAWIIVRSQVKGRRVLDTLTFFPQATPSIIIGLSVMILYLSIPNPFYGTVWIIAIACTTKYLAYGSRTMKSAIMQIHPELEEASQVLGLPWWRTFVSIILPLMAPTFVNGWIWVAVHAMRELSAAMMLYTPDSVVLSTLIWSLWETGRTAEASALGVILILMLIGVTWFGRWFLLRRFRSF